MAASSAPLLAIAESLDANGNVAMHSESFVEIRLTDKITRAEFDTLAGKWITVIPTSHNNGVLYCKKLNFVNKN